MARLLQSKLTNTPLTPGLRGLFHGTGANSSTSVLGFTKWPRVEPTAYVWVAHDGVGHASISLGFPVGWSNPDDQKKMYVSIFPGKGVDGTAVEGQNGADGTSLRPGAMHWAEWMTYEQDCKAEGGGEYREPEFAIPLPLLNVAKARAEWEDIRGNADAHYRLARKNCSTVVARVMRAGGADKFIPLLKRGWLAHCAIWMPMNVLAFAAAASEGMNNAAVTNLPSL